MVCIIFAGMLGKVENCGGNQSSGSRCGSAYAPRIIMIIGGLIKTLQYNAPDKRQS